MNCRAQKLKKNVEKVCKKKNSMIMSQKLVYKFIANM